MTTSTAGPHRTTPRTPPTLPGSALLGSALDLRRDFLGTLLRASREYGPVVRLDAGPPRLRRTLYVVSSAAGIEQVLTDPATYRKDTVAYTAMRDVLGDGLLTSQDEEWHRQRRLLAPLFTRRRLLTRYAPEIVEEAQLHSDEWDDAARTGRPVDAHAEMARLAAMIAGKVLLGVDMAEHASNLTAEMGPANAAMLRRAASPPLLPSWFPTSSARAVRRARKGLREVVTDLIDARRKEAAAGRRDPDDALGVLFEAEEHGGERYGVLDERAIVDQALVLLVAGHETTATTLACALVELARHRGVQDRLRDALWDAIPTGEVTADGVAQVPLLTDVVKEVLRLYPPAPNISRLSHADTDVDGYAVPASATLVASPWAMHRTAALWPGPDRFDPDRWATADPDATRHTWVPFGLGPHACIGAQLAMLEATLVLAVLLMHYRFATDVERIPLVAGITMRPGAPLPVHVTYPVEARRPCHAATSRRIRATSRARSGDSFPPSSTT